MKLIKVGAVLVLIAAIAAGFYFYDQYRTAHPTTQDAYLNAHTLYISPEINGRIIDVPVQSYQSVKKGDVLAVIDDRQYQLALKKAQTEIELNQSTITVAEAQARASKAQSDAAHQTQNNAASENARLQKLVKRGMISKEQADNARFSYNEASASAKATEESIEAANANVQEANVNLKAAQLALEQAELNLSYTVIRAPIDGQLGEVGLRSGQFVSTGEQLFPMIDTAHYWVDANFKETDLHVIQPGQVANVVFDMYPDVTFTGTVESLSPASGTRFSLIPSENATGNWVKVTQRFPVRVVIDTQDVEEAEQHVPALRIGASADITIDTTQANPNTQGQP